MILRIILLSSLFTDTLKKKILIYLFFTAFGAKLPAQSVCSMCLWLLHKIDCQILDRKSVTHCHCTKNLT